MSRYAWGRILTLALDGKAILKAPPFGHKNPPRPAITTKQEPEAVHAGALLFNSHCFLCHGLNAVAGPLPDLRYSSREVLDSLPSIVLDGARASGGMPSDKKILSEKDVKEIRTYIIARAQEVARPQTSSRKMFKKMRLRIDPKQPTSKCLVIILAARADIPRSPTKSLFLPSMLDYRKPTENRQSRE